MNDFYEKNFEPCVRPPFIPLCFQETTLMSAGYAMETPTFMIPVKAVTIFADKVILGQAVVPPDEAWKKVFEEIVLVVGKGLNQPGLRITYIDTDIGLI